MTQSGHRPHELRRKLAVCKWFLITAPSDRGV